MRKEKEASKFLIYKMNKQILSWLINCPASDINFKGNLEKADLETLKEAYKKTGLSKLAYKLIRIKINKISPGEII